MRKPRGGGGQELGSAHSTPGRWGTRDLAYTEMGKEDLGKILLLLQGWDFGLQQDLLCVKWRGRSWVIPGGSFVTLMPFHSTRNVPSW